MAQKNFVFSRSVENFDPAKFLEHGKKRETIDENGTIVEGEPTCYLPAWVRQMWYNQYCFENQKVMPLTTKILRYSDGEVVVEATLSEVFNPGTENQVIIPIQTGLASAFITPGDNSALERCETCAKARCLGAAGFSIREEKGSMIDEGNTPVDGDLADRKNVSEIKKEPETKEKPKAKRGRPRKKKAENDNTENIEEKQETFPIPNISSFPGLSQDINKKEECDKLEICLKAFFPYGSFKGEQVVDIIESPKFKEVLDKHSPTNFGKLMVEDNLSVNELISTLKKYLDNPSKEERSILVSLINKIREEDDEDY